MNDNPFPAPSLFADLSRRALFGTIITGVVAGALSVILTKVFDKFIIEPALCNSAAETVCANSDAIAFHIAGILTAILAVIMLVNVSVYRPLLVAIAVTVSTWGIYESILSQLAWGWAIGVAAIIYLLAYLTFAWILRIYQLVIALLLTAILAGTLLFLSYL